MKDNFYSYFAYGLRIKSALPIPEFIAADGGDDVTIYVENDPNFNLKDYVSPELLEYPALTRIIREEALLYAKDAGYFLVQGGHKIIVIPVPNASEELIRYFLVGRAMAILLYQRGLLVLHASAVDVNGSAVAFLGVSGEGKSSTAAIFHAHGHDIITDDVTSVTLGKGPATVSPGFPQIKLSRKVAAFLGYDLESLFLLHPEEERQGYRLTQNFPQVPLPIRHIYLLTEAPELSIEPLRLHEAVMELTRHSHPIKFRAFLGAPHFLQCAMLAKECKVYRFNRPRDLTLLPELVRLVKEHVACDFLAEEN